LLPISTETWTLALRCQSRVRPADRRFAGTLAGATGLEPAKDTPSRSDDTRHGAASRGPAAWPRGSESAGSAETLRRIGRGNEVHRARVERVLPQACLGELDRVGVEGRRGRGGELVCGRPRRLEGGGRRLPAPHRRVQRGRGLPRVTPQRGARRLRNVR